MNRSYRFLLAIFILIVATAGFGCSQAEEAEPSDAARLLALADSEPKTILPDNEMKRVFLLNSYHPEFVYTRNMNAGIMAALAEERFVDGKNMTTEFLYMDTKKRTSEAWKQEIGQKAVARIRQWQPHVVIASDENAQLYAVKHLKDSPVPIVFMGVNGDPVKYNLIDNLDRPGHNITGCIERERLSQTITMLQRLVGNVKRLAILCDDGPTGRPVVDRLKAQAPTIGLEVVAAEHIGDFDQWKTFVKRIQTQADVLALVVYHTLRDAAGNHIPPKEVLSWTVHNNKLPDIGFWDWAVEGGLLCSEAISGYQQGHYAGTVAAYVLMGQSPADFPVNSPRTGKPCINMARARMLGIQIPDDMRQRATVYMSIGSDQ